MTDKTLSSQDAGRFVSAVLVERTVHCASSTNSGMEDSSTRQVDLNAMFRSCLRKRRLRPRALWERHRPCAACTLATSGLSQSATRRREET
jgi:hypothetical protein